jgi:hypothetical protein
MLFDKIEIVDCAILDFEIVSTMGSTDYLLVDGSDL